MQHNQFDIIRVLLRVFFALAGGKTPKGKSVLDKPPERQTVKKHAKKRGKDKSKRKGTK